MAKDGRSNLAKDLDQLPRGLKDGLHRPHQIRVAEDMLHGLPGEATCLRIGGVIVRLPKSHWGGSEINQVRTD